MSPARNLHVEIKIRILSNYPQLFCSFTSHSAFDNYFLQAQRVRKLVQKDFDSVFRIRIRSHFLTPLLIEKELMSYFIQVQSTLLRLWNLVSQIEIKSLLTFKMFLRFLHLWLEYLLCRYQLGRLRKMVMEKLGGLASWNHDDQSVRL